jgi:protein NrfD
MTVITDRSLPARDAGTTGWPERLAWVLAAIAAIIGVIGVVWRFTGGHGAADYGSYVPWGLWIAAYIALVGASAGAFGFAALILMHRRTEHYRLAVLAILVAFGAFAAGMLNVWLDLGHPMRAWRLVVNNRPESVMGLMAWFYTAYGGLLLLCLWSVRKGRVPSFMERWAWVGLLFAAVFAGAEGALFGVVGAQPTWESGVTPVLFIAEAGLVGLGLVAATAALFGFLSPPVARRIGHWLLGLIGLVLVIEVSELSTGLWAAVPAKAETFRAVLTGDYWWAFWLLHLGVGALVPVALILAGRGRAPFVGVAGGLVAAMALTSKLNLVVPALVQEDLEGLAGAFTGPGLVHDYFPSTMEWFVAFGSVGMAALIVLAGRRLLERPLGSSEPAVGAPTGGREGT